MIAAAGIALPDFIAHARQNLRRHALLLPDTNYAVRREHFNSFIPEELRLCLERCAKQFAGITFLRTPDSELDSITATTTVFNSLLVACEAKDQLKTYVIEATVKSGLNYVDILVALAIYALQTAIEKGYLSLTDDVLSLKGGAPLNLFIPET